MNLMTPASPSVATLLADLRQIFGQQLVSLVVYGGSGDGPQHPGPARCLALVDTLGAAELDGCARRVHAWHTLGLATPLILPEREFRESLDAFPLEYGAIIRRHEVAHGPDPFVGARINPEDARRACETQVKSHLVHLREAYLEAANAPREVAALVAASIPAFASLLRHVAWLGGDGNAAVDAGLSVAHAGARLAGLPDGLMDALLPLEHDRGLASGDPARLFPEYLAAVEQLARFVNNWSRP